MIRFVHCVRRRPNLTIDEFRRFWNSHEFGELLEELRRLTGASRVQRSSTLVIDMNVELMQERGSAEPFDALLEVWLENARSLDKRLESPELSRLLNELETYQSQFIDFTASRRFFTEWESSSPL